MHELEKRIKIGSSSAPEGNDHSNEHPEEKHPREEFLQFGHRRRPAEILQNNIACCGQTKQQRIKIYIRPKNSIQLDRTEPWPVSGNQFRHYCGNGQCFPWTDYAIPKGQKPSGQERRLLSKSAFHIFNNTPGNRKGCRQFTKAGRNRKKGYPAQEKGNHSCQRPASQYDPIPYHQNPANAYYSAKSNVKIIKIR